MRFVRILVRPVPKVSTLLLLTLNLAGCSAPRAVPPPESITVEGLVSVRGNEPFTELMMETDQRNTYVLKFASPADRGEVQRAAPARFVVRGGLYAADWQGERRAFLDVRSWEPSRP